MRRIQSKIDTGSATFKAYRKHNLQVVGDFKEKQRATHFDRPARDLARLEKQDKLFVRERIKQLLDPGTPFLEVMSLAANQAYDGTVPGAGVVAGIGIVNGREVAILANDGSVKGGAWYPLSVKKIIRLTDIAIENRLPVIHLVDSAGAYLPMQTDIFPDKYMGGRIFRNQCILSKLGCEQVAVVLGHCTAGGAYVPTLCEYSIMVRGTGCVFLGGPPLVKAATGEDVAADDLGGAALHTQVSGTADYAVETEAEGLAMAREIVGTFRRKEKTLVDRRDPEAPHYDPEELYGIIPDDVKKQFDMREVIARIVDGSRFHEFRPDYGTSLVTGFAYIHGFKVGILGNNGILFNDSAEKATSFMQICNRDRVPLVFLQNITGFMIGEEYERKGITKNGAQMVMTQATVDVPKLTVMCNGSYGAGNYAMAGRAYDSRLLFSWPNSKISVMGMEQAVGVLTQIKIASLAREGKKPTSEELVAIEDSVRDEYEQKSSAYWATSEMWDDGIIDPADTRNALGMAISASLNAPIETDRIGLLRI